MEVHISLEVRSTGFGRSLPSIDDITSESSEDVLDMVFISLSVVVQRETPGSILACVVHGKMRSVLAIAPRSGGLAQ